MPRLCLAADHLGRDRHAVTDEMEQSKIRTTKNIYSHLFAQDRALILKAMNQAVSRLYVQADDKAA